MDTQDVEDLTVKFAAIALALEQRMAVAEQQVTQAAASLRHTAQDVAASSQRLADSATAEFRRTAQVSLAEGMRPALEQAEVALRQRMQEVAGATRELERRIRKLNALHAAGAWKALIIAAVASLMLTGVAVYAGLQAHQRVQRAQWVDAINAAVAAGKLTVCKHGGVCVRIGKQWVQLDEP